MTAPIYLDYHATTPVDPRVLSAIAPYQSANYGNPSSADHAYGEHAAQAVQTAKRQIAQLVNTQPRHILFTSGATESLNLAIQGTVNHLARSGKARSGKARSGKARSGKLPHVATTAVEHGAVLATCRALAHQQRIRLTELPVDHRAQIDLNDVETCCADGLDLLCLMAANHEVGTIYPVQAIAKIAQRYGVAYLCDAAQALGKVPLNFADWGITLLAGSAHKLYGPKGVGLLVVRSDHRLDPLFYGGGQQQGLRPGTLNVPGIVGFGAACHLRSAEMSHDEATIARRRDRLQTLLQERIPRLQVNGDLGHRLAGNLHISVPGIPNSAVIARVQTHLALSTGSACTSGVEAPSPVLRAMHLADDQLEGALRISLGKFTTDDEVAIAAEQLATAIAQIQTLIGVAG